MRGTPQAYEALLKSETKPSNDTLYFISNHDDNSAILYLGSKRIAGGESDLERFSIESLKDVVIDGETLAEKSLLVYDLESKSWVNKPFESLRFVGANGEANGVSGFVPAPLATENNYFLRGDGTWAPIAASEVQEANVKSVTNDNPDTSHDDIIANVTADWLLAKGDIIVIKDLIVEVDGEKKYQHTAYVYDGEHWAAMDGNYNAENVYFDEDFLFTTTIGTVTELTNGSATKTAAGLNLKQFFASLFAEEKQPSIVEPTYSLSASAVLEATAEIGNYITGYSWDGSWSSGSYEFGSKENSSTATGITPSYSVSENVENKTADTLDGSFTLDAPIQIDTVTSKTYATISGTCSYEASPRTPVTNFGNNASAGAIEGNEIEKSAAVKVTGYRSSFKYIGTDCETAIDSAFIRSATNMNANSKKFGTVEIPAGTKRVMFAVPGSATLSSVIDVDGMGLDVKGNFTKSTIKVEGANGFTAADYSVFVAENANGMAATKYTVTIS